MSVRHSKEGPMEELQRATAAPRDASPDASGGAAPIDADRPPSAGDPLEELRRELAAEQDRALRLRAEMENLRARNARELVDQTKYAVMPLAKDIVPTIDNLERALEAASSDAQASSLLEGVRMVREQLLAALARHHCVPITPDGEPFDPQFHEAILQQPSDALPALQVLQTVQPGYRLHDRVVRAAQVIVSSGPQTNP